MKIKTITTLVICGLLAAFALLRLDGWRYKSVERSVQPAVPDSPLRVVTESLPASGPFSEPSRATANVEDRSALLARLLDGFLREETWNPEQDSAFSALAPDEQTWLLQAWGARSSNAVLFAWRLSESNPDSPLFSSAITAFAVAHPNEVNQLLNSHEGLADARNVVVTALLEAGHHAAAEAVAEQDSGSIAAFAMKLADDPGFDGIALLRRLEASADSVPIAVESALDAIAQTKRERPEMLQQFVVEAMNSGFSSSISLALAVAPLSPAVALEWLDSLELLQDVKNRAAVEAFQGMIALNPLDGSQWLNAHTDSAFFSSLAFELTLRTIGDDAIAAQAWASIIPDVILRAQAFDALHTSQAQVPISTIDAPAP